MNLNEFRQKMESDATKENEQLKRDLADLEKKYNDMCEAYSEKVRALNDDCRVLANRCFGLTNGAMCLFCMLHEYGCKHAVPLDDKLKAIQKERLIYET